MATGVAAEIGQHLLWPAERRLGVDHPVEAAHPGQQAGESGWLGQAGEIAEELEDARVEGRPQLLQKEAAEQTRQHAHGQKEAGPAGDPVRSIERDAAARHDAMEVGMIVQVLTPAMQHRDEADLGAEVFGIGSDRAQRLGRRLEQDRVGRRLVLEGDGGELRRQREDDMEVCFMVRIQYGSNRIQGRGACVAREAGSPRIISTMRPYKSFASAARLRGGGPILQTAIGARFLFGSPPPRIIDGLSAKSDRTPSCLFGFLAVLFTLAAEA